MRRNLWAAILCAVLLVGLGLAVPMAVYAAALATCGGVSSISYPNPPAQDFQGTVDHVSLTIGAAPIGEPNGVDNGVIVVSEIIFDLSCRHKGCSNNINTPCTVDATCGGGNFCLTLLPGTCAPDGSSPNTNTVIGFNGNISSFCTDGPTAAGGTNTPIFFSANNGGSGAASPNEVVFTSSLPMHILHDTTSFCTINFDVVKLSGQSFDDTPTIFEQRGGFLIGQCDNGLAASALQTGSLLLDNTPTPTPTVASTPTPTATAPLSGAIRYYSNSAPVGGATVQLQVGATMSVQSDGNGQYAFFGIPTGDYLVQPSKQGDQGNGISVLDAVYILQALAGLRILTPAQLLAADVTGNGTISTLDAVRILQVKAGLITRFEVAQTCGSDWAFIPVPAPAPNQTLTTPQMRTGVCQAGAITFEPLASPAPNQDFSAVLFGDVTGNWQPTTPTPTPTPTA